MSLKLQLYELVKSRYPKFVNGGELERFALDNGFKASNASRRAREIVKEGSFLRQIKGRSVEYQFIPPKDFKPAEKKKEPVGLGLPERSAYAVYDGKWTG